MSGGDNGKKRKEEESGHESSPKSVQVFRCRLEFPTTHTTGTECRRRLGLVVATGSQWHARFLECEKKRRRNAHSNQLIPKICHRLMTPTRSGRRKEINTRGHSLWKKNFFFFLVGIEPGGKEKKRNGTTHGDKRTPRSKECPVHHQKKKGQQSLSSLQFLTLCGEGVGGVYMAGTAGCIQRRVPNSMKHAKSNQFNWRFYLSALPDFSPSLSLSPPRAPGKRIDRAACRRRAKKLYNVLRASISYKDGGIERSDSFVGDQSQ